MCLCNTWSRCTRPGKLTYKSYCSLLGLLEHVLFLMADIDRSATLGMYTPLNNLTEGAAKLSDTTYAGRGGDNPHMRAGHGVDSRRL